MRKDESLYDDEISAAISRLPEEDRQKLFRSVFNAMLKSMRAYYSQLGYPNNKVNQHLQVEVNKVKNLVINRLSDIEDEPTDDRIKPERVKRDDQFVSDATIDLHFLMDEVYKSK